MPNIFFNQKRSNSAAMPLRYGGENKKWSEYVYKDVRGLKKISLTFEIPLSILIARIKKGKTLHEAVTHCNEE
ncbi:hypothetical protein A6E04_07405 [Aliivibrio logei]|uniref:Uncharacterized protein n=2 Tax=Aliivibrio logei TaxID=688 RepID=A0A1B9P042_ALILO|nr:hypothetical protein A6E04_07405 [Aliivibrio logei]OEF12664.1 hypothetical protein A1Q5_09290 [Aliivibrio logei 5S-186]